MKERPAPEPQIELAAKNDSVNACEIHKTETFVEVGNNLNWEPTITTTPGAMMFTCKLCDSVRVYRLLPEKTKLHESN